MRRTTVTVPMEMVDDLISLTGAKTKSKAVVIAIADEIRRKKIERIKSLVGKVEFEKNAMRLRHEDRRIG